MLRKLLRIYMGLRADQIHGALDTVIDGASAKADCDYPLQMKYTITQYNMFHAGVVINKLVTLGLCLLYCI